MQLPRITVSTSGSVFLTLPGKEYKSRRCLGEIIGDTFYCQRSPERHLFRQFGGSYGFNYELLRHGSFRLVVVHLPFGDKLVTTREHLLKVGRFLNFQRNQLERQVFVSLNEINIPPDGEVEPKPDRPIPPPIEPTLFDAEAA